MKAKIYPGIINDGSVTIPPSKSLAHRCIIAACLANGKSVIKNIDYSNDIKTTIEGLKQLGAQIDCYDNYVVVNGIKDFNYQEQYVVDCSESGSTIRFLIPIFSLTNKKVAFVGSQRLLQRPQSVYQDIFDKNNLIFIHNADKIEINGKLSLKDYYVDGSISSQFISGLLFTLPLLQHDSIIHIENKFESKSYVDLTVSILKQFGINIEVYDNLIKINGNQTYISCDMVVEADYSQLAFFAALGCINNDLKCLGLSHDTLQGDFAIINILKQMNAQIEEIDGGYLFKKSDLKGVKINLEDCPDLGPMLMALGSVCSGQMHIYNASRLRIKESDRIDDVICELNKLNVINSSTYDEVFINFSDLKVIDENLTSHNDHRIVMALSILATILKQPVVINDCMAINKSYPNFFKDLAQLNIKIEISE